MRESFSHYKAYFDFRTITDRIEKEYLALRGDCRSPQQRALGLYRQSLIASVKCVRERLSCLPAVCDLWVVDTHSVDKVRRGGGM